LEDSVGIQLTELFEGWKLAFGQIVSAGKDALRGDAVLYFIAGGGWVLIESEGYLCGHGGNLIGVLAAHSMEEMYIINLSLLK
jgi:hypothetical protein